MTQHFNQLTPAEAERLAILAEEAGEIIHCVGKILRHGYESCHPDDPTTTNRQLLTKEVSDLHFALALMDADFDPTVGEDVDAQVARKMRYLHHQIEDPAA